MGKEESVEQMSQVHQSTERIYTYHVWTRKTNLYVSNYTIFIYMKYYYSHSYTGNSSKHEQSCLDALIAWREALYGAHISEWEDVEDPDHRDN
jgi:hypothetical protein